MVKLLGVCRYFRLYFAGYTSRDIPNGASASTVQAALMSIKQDQATTTAAEGAETVTVTVAMESAASPVVWRVTFLSHLEVS